MGGFFSRQDVSISIFGRTKEFSEVRGTSLMCNFGVRSRFLDVIYGVRPPNGSPVGEVTRYSNLSFFDIFELILLQAAVTRNNVHALVRQT